MNMKKWRHILANLTLMVIGSAIMAVAYPLFLIPHHFVPGGVSGVAIIANYFFRIPVGMLILVLNIPIMLLGAKAMGKHYLVKSIIGTILSSAMIDFFGEILRLPSATDNPILASIYGGFVLGVGLGVIFRAGGSTGGTDVIGQTVNKYTGMSVGFGIMIVDFLIISASGLFFHTLEAPLYGYIVLVISSKVIDTILEGWNYSKMVLITSTRPEAIEKFILTELDRSGTALRSRSLYLNRDGETIMTVVHRKQLADLRHFIKENDPEAFVIINDTYTVLGKGFKSHLV